MCSGSDEEFEEDCSEDERVESFHGFDDCEDDGWGSDGDELAFNWNSKAKKFRVNCDKKCGEFKCDADQWWVDNDKIFCDDGFKSLCRADPLIAKWGKCYSNFGKKWRSCEACPEKRRKLCNTFKNLKLSWNGLDRRVPVKRARARRDYNRVSRHLDRFVF